MTDFTLPPFAVPYGGWWIDVDLDGDLAGWARRSAEDVLARWGVRNRRRAGQLAAMLEAAGAATRGKQQGAISAMLLYPALGEGIRAGVLFFPVDMSGHDETSGWDALTSWVLSADQAAAADPEVTAIETPAGTCRRIRLSAAERDAGNRVVEHLLYLWLFPQYGAGIVMSCTFQSLAEAGQWRSAVDELAASARLDQTAATPAS